MDKLLLEAFFTRHQESQQNADEDRDWNTSLTDEGKQSAERNAKLLDGTTLGKVDIVYAGTLDRHDQSLDLMLRRSKYGGEIIHDPRFNAVQKGSPLFEDPTEVTVHRFGLDKFAPGSDGLYHAEDEFGALSFDPVAIGVFPFNPLYCMAYWDRRLRSLVFPGEESLRPIEEIEKDVVGVQKELIQKASSSSRKPLRVLAVSSCSPNGFGLEYAAYGTVGENIIGNYPEDGNSIFPQEHDQLMVLGYTERDLAEGRKRLRVIEGNVNINKYLDTLKGN